MTEIKIPFIHHILKTSLAFCIWKTYVVYQQAVWVLVLVFFVFFSERKRAREGGERLRDDDDEIVIPI